MERLAIALRSRGLADEIAYGFLKGTPDISQAMKALAAPSIVVYPLFFSDGYFTGTKLPQLLADAGCGTARRSIRVLPPLGLDAGLADIVAARAQYTAYENGYDDREVAIVLLAHGSTKSAASRKAAENLAGRLRARGQFASVSAAFLDEAPALGDAIAGLAGPVVVVGLFAGEGLHGAGDLPQLIAATGRADVASAGSAGAWPEIAAMVAAAIERATRPS